MKKTFTSLLFVLFVFVSTMATAQSTCVTKARSLVSLTSKQTIQASYFSESVATQQMYCLNFQNTGSATVTFSFTLKDKDGKIISGPQSITLAPGQSVNGFDNPAFNKGLVIPLAEGQHTSDFTVEINL